MTQPDIWEDEDYIYVPEQFFDLLPDAYRRWAVAQREEGVCVLKTVDKDLNGLRRIFRASMSTASLRYILHRLRNTPFEATTEAMMEQEMLTTAFVATYGRLFTETDGARKLSESDIPDHLKQVHRELMELRHERYAHNGAHQSVDDNMRVDFAEDGFHIYPSMNVGLHIGGRNEWEELVAVLDAHMHGLVEKALRKMEAKTGKPWRIAQGPAPDWVGQAEG